MTTALVLAGHGSHISPETAGLVWRLVDHVRYAGLADEVTAAFWKEQPSFSRVLHTLVADEIVIVPLFTTAGYFARQVIPAEMKLSGKTTQVEINGIPRTLHYTRTLGEHPSIDMILRMRAEAALKETGFAPDQTAVVLIGHGTRRNPDSRTANEQHAAELRTVLPQTSVITVYLDDTPSIPEAYTLTAATNLIVLPYFLALGSHTTIDVPGELGLPSGVRQAEINGRNVYYADPIGIDQQIVNAAVSLSFEPGRIIRRGPNGTAASTQSAWNNFPAAGREVLLERLAEKGQLRFGELMLTEDEVSVAADYGMKETLLTPEALRTRVRENPFRSLPTARNLPRGWRVAINPNDKNQIHAVVETIYPGAVADWAAHQTKKFVPQHFDAVIARQVGMFRALDSMNDEDRARTVGHVCGGCVRHATWFYGDSPADALPCPEPCNHWLSAAKGEE